MAKWIAFCCVFALAPLLASCSDSLNDRAARHERRGDAYVEQDEFRKAVIEYKNAVRDKPDHSDLHWKLASAAFKTGDVPAAAMALRRVVQLDPAHFDARWSLGDLYLAAGKTQEVAKLAEELLVARPQHPAGYLLRAGIALDEDRIVDAIGSLQQAAALDPTMPRPRLALGHVYFSQRDLAAAGEWYARAVQADPSSVEARLAHGYFLCATGALDEGRREFHHALESSRDQEFVTLLLADRYIVLGWRDEAARLLDGLVVDMNSQKARKALIELRLAGGQVAEAKPLVNNILEADAHDAVGLYFKGRIALAENDVLQAAGLFEEAIGRDVSQAGAHLHLGWARLAQNRMDSAQEEFNEAIRLQPYNDTAHLALAKLYLALHKSTEAEQEAWRALRLNPSNPEAALVAGDALVQATRWPKAESVYDEIVRQLPGQPVGYVKLGGLRRLQGRPSEAATFFAQALSRAPDDLVILQDYLVALVESNQAHQADRVLDQYLTKASHDPNLWRLAGRVHLSQRRTDQAEQALRKAVDLAPDLALVYYELGQLYLVQRKLSAAESAFQAALKKDETNSEVHTALGLVLAAQGRVDLANTHYRRAVQLDRHNVVAANNLAASLTEQQEFDDALGLALAAHDRAPSNPGIQDTLGWIYYKKNRFEDAHRLLAEASAALPQHPTVRYHHAMLLSKIGKQEAALSELKTALSLPGGFPEADRAARMVAANKIDE
jgi:tetratricopeptide (TPR) repeat protein